MPYPTKRSRQPPINTHEFAVHFPPPRAAPGRQKPARGRKSLQYRLHAKKIQQCVQYEPHGLCDSPTKHIHRGNTATNNRTTSTTTGQKSQSSTPPRYFFFFSWSVPPSAFNESQLARLPVHPTSPPQCRRKQTVPDAAIPCRRGGKGESCKCVGC